MRARQDPQGHRRRAAHPDQPRNPRGSAGAIAHLNRLPLFALLVVGFGGHTEESEPATLAVLNNGNVVIGNYHAGKGQPLLVQVRRDTKRVVWQLDEFDWLGNSVPNSVR